MLKNGTAWFRLGMILFCLTAGDLAASDGKNLLNLSNFHFVRTAFLPENIACQDQKIYAIKLDETFFQSTENPVNDICVIDQNGQKVPFVLKKHSIVSAAFRENQLAGKIVRNQQLPDGRNAIDFELDENNRSISCVELVGDKLPARTLLTIAVGDGKNWQTAINKLQLSDLSLLPETVNRRFPLPEKLTGKLVRLILEKGKFPPLEAVRVFEEQQLEPLQSVKLTEYKLSRMGSKNNRSNFKIAFNTSYTPLTRLEIALEKELYLNKVTLLGSNDRRKWHEISSGTVRKIDLDCSNTLEFPESRYKYIMLEIDHMPNSPVKLQKVKAFGPLYCWAVEGRKDRENLSIYYGPAMPLQPENHQLQTDSEALGAYILSEQKANHLRKTGVRDRSSWSHLAGALIVFFAFIAALTLMSKVKRSQKLLPED